MCGFTSKSLRLLVKCLKSPDDQVPSLSILVYIQIQREIGTGLLLIRKLSTLLTGNYIEIPCK